MKIDSTTVTKLVLTEIPGQDVIAIYAENMGPGIGKITITKFGESWTAYWSQMGVAHTIESFFLKASPAYLAGKLKVGIREEIDDENTDALITLLKREIIKMRLAKDVSRERARELYNDACSLWCWGEHHDICLEVLGDEWWLRMPRKPNPEYKELIEVIGFVKEAFQQLRKEQP